MSRRKAVGRLKGERDRIANWDRQRRRGQQIPDLTGPDLFEANPEEANLFSANLTRASLISASLTEANLGKANLSDSTRFVNVDLSEVQGV
jgi:uncharacterized protein YjbI with pentapeptide repeats